MSLVTTGHITEILAVESGQTKAGKEWKKQGFVIQTEDKYNPFICFSLFGDEKIELLKGFSSGQNVSVSFNVSSREFNGKFYHNIDAWKIQSLESQAQETNTPPANTPSNPVDDTDEDVPF